MPTADVDTENSAVLTVLREADAFYREQQRLGRTVRRGFLDLAKARQQHGAVRGARWECRAARAAICIGQAAHRQAAHKSASANCPCPPA